MTTTARRALADCRKALDLLEMESDAAQFRVLWVAAVALLRSVGHVLQKVDSTQSPLVAKAIDDTWERWKTDKEANAIFFEFIEEERNNILKEYEFGFLSGPVEVLVTPNDEFFTLEDSMYCPVSGGRFDGEDCRDVVAEGIAWWERELSAIDRYSGG